MSTSNATTVVSSTTTVQTATTTTVATTQPNPRLSVVGAGSSRVGISPLETAFTAAFQGAIPQLAAAISTAMRGQPTPPSAIPQAATPAPAPPTVQRAAGEPLAS